jgi:putative addiction module component (TIGR02574 family)
VATPDHIREQALALSEKERAELARDLLWSLDGEPDPDAARKWAAEIERRVREIRDGSVALVDGDKALERVRARLKNRK